MPRTARVGFGVVVAIAIAPLVPAVPATDPASWEGMLILAKEMITGVMMGFAMRLVFAAIEYAGELAAGRAEAILRETITPEDQRKLFRDSLTQVGEA